MLSSVFCLVLLILGAFLIPEFLLFTANWIV
nr:MAG TPA: hypothetical protein [Caudoviricetes sp.]DAM36473.1 MAG TPA: hypothetical protein [Caudoviricetes sp.]